jgi:predicted metal-dependent peptidase
MTEERKLQRVTITLIRNPKFALLSGLLMVGKTYIADNVPTAKTNGRDEMYGRAFVKSLDEKELAFVRLHEVGHKMYRHLTTWRKLYNEDKGLANAACDYVINIMLHDLDPAGDYITMPKYKDGPMKGQIMGLLDERFRGMNSKEVFDILKQEPRRGGSGGNPNEEGFDEHGWDEAEALGEDEAKELEREIDQAIRQGIINDRKLNGEGAGGLARDLGEMLKPKVNWRAVLAEFVRSVCAGKDNSSWRRPNRRFIGSDVYLPTMISERVGRILIAVDTSGSIAGPELNAFLTEVSSICNSVNPEVIDLIYWDSQVAAHETYTGTDSSSLIQSTRPKGGGGTSPSCITAYVSKHKLEPECAVVLTDGYVGSDWGGAWPCPVLWCVVGGNQVVSPVGKTVHVES